MKKTSRTPSKKKLSTKGKIILGLLGLGTGYVFYRQLTRTKTPSQTDPVIPGNSGNNNNNQLPESNFPLSQGSTGSKVKALQAALIRLGGDAAEHVIATGGADGIWGDGTSKAMQAAGYPTALTESKWSQIVGGSGSTTTTTSGVFPLKKGKTGPEVKQLQQALINKGGTIAGYIISTGGADGIWGDGTQKAVLAAGYPPEITESAWNYLVKGGISIAP